MKEIFDYCTQVRRYGDSEGKCLIELEPNDIAEEIIKEYTKDRAWYEQTYSNPRRVKKYNYYTHEFKDNGYVEKLITVTGDLIVFDTHSVYLD